MAKKWLWKFNFCWFRRFLSENRISESVRLLSSYDIVVNDLSLYSNGNIIEKYLSKRINSNSKIDIDFILNKNIFGFSNTAMKLNIIDDVSLPKNLIAVDWYFFSILLLSTNNIVFTNNILTYYRQHEYNTIGIGSLNKSSIAKGIDVKMLHYNKLQALDKRYKSLLKLLIKFKKTVNIKKYMQKIKKTIKYFYGGKIIIRNICENSTNKQ